MPVTSIAWSPDDKYVVASSNQSRKIHVWDLKSRKLVREFEHPLVGTNFNELSWSPTGRYLAICSGRHDIFVLYDSKSWEEVPLVLPEHDPTCAASAFSSDGQQLAVLGGSLSIFAAPDWRSIKFADLRNSLVQGVPFAFSAVGYLPGTHILLIGGNDIAGTDMQRGVWGDIWVLNPAETIPSREFQAYRNEPPGAPGQLISFAISPDGREVATGTTTGASGVGVRSGTVTASVHIVSVNDGTLLGAPLDGQPFGSQEGLAYTPDGRYLIVAHSSIYTSHAIHVIDAESLRVVDLVHAGNTVYGLAVSPDSKQFAVSAGLQIAVYSLPAKNQH
jgi:WD40 repeat protein